MTDQGNRRFTDREVALILKRASEVEEAEPSPGAGGLSLDDLREIAREVGISRTAIDRAVASLEGKSGIGPSVAGAPTVRKALRAVPRELDEPALARLMSVVDARTDTAGSITEALGSVRWIGRDRFKSVRVSISPRDGETAIEVVEKAEPKMRRVFHLLPAAWGAILTAPLVDTLGASLLGVVVVFVLAVSVGLGVGRLAWGLVSAASQRRVGALADALAAEAVEIPTAEGEGE